jgi:hypothetical protein
MPEPTAFDQEMACNRQAYEKIKDQIRRDYAGKFVAIAFGKIVAVSPVVEDVIVAVERLEPTPEHSVVFLAEEEPVFEPIQATYTEFL